MDEEEMDEEEMDEEEMDEEKEKYKIEIGTLKSGVGNAWTMFKEYKE
jgi:hypothetical protein